MQETVETLTASDCQPSAAWLIALFLILGSGAGYAVGSLLSQRALAIVLGLAVGAIAAVIPALIVVAATRHPAPVLPPTAAPPAPQPWGAPRQPQNILMLNLDDLIQKRAAMTPLPPQYLQLSNPDGGRPDRIVGDREEW